MNLAIDYDDTYTRDPATWNLIIFLLRQAGHKVYLVTWRDVEETNEEIGVLATVLDGVYFTARKAKAKYMFDQGICIDVMIDDNPSSWIQDMQTYSASGLWE